MTGFIYQSTDAFCQYPGFSRTGACNDQQWTVAVIDDKLLRLRQPSM